MSNLEESAAAPALQLSLGAHLCIRGRTVADLTPTSLTKGKLWNRVAVIHLSSSYMEINIRIQDGCQLSG